MRSEDIKAVRIADVSESLRKAPFSTDMARVLAERPPENAARDRRPRRLERAPEGSGPRSILVDLAQRRPEVLLRISRSATDSHAVAR
jgi:hypothetical protein